MTTLTPTPQVFEASNWRTGASCLLLEPEIFFPEGSAEVISAQTDLAQRACRACPVQSYCLNWALETLQGIGIWGGLTPEERRSCR
jgi:WhiB family redox-sensing transcriptional regulator